MPNTRNSLWSFSRIIYILESSKYQNNPRKVQFQFFIQNSVSHWCRNRNKGLDTNKASYLSDIPTKILKQNLNFISGYVNKSIISSTFPSILKLTDITPVYKKDSRYKKSNYRPFSVLPNLPKIFEKIMYDQISSFLKTFSLDIKLVSGKVSIDKVV